MNESIIALNNQKPRDVFGQYRDGVLDAIVPERQRVQNAPCPACAKLFEEFEKDTTDEGFDFFVTLDHVLQFRDFCQFCRLLFEALCLENNDPMKASAVANHVQDDIGNSLAEWAKPLPVEDRFPLRAISNINRGAPDGNLRYGHILDRRIDLQHCREWVHHCGERHRDECDAPKWSRRLREPPSVPIRVVDVMDECIVEMDNRDFKYVALSYVNGNFFGTTLSNATIARLMEPRGLQTGRIAPGQTLLDAIEVTKALKVRYLWVDRLCILHENDKDIKSQTFQMDVIYGNAFATIVAADGESANSGLDGVSNDRAVSDLSVQVKENLSFLVPVNKTPRNNLWETRAWTYQEMLLSKRLLIFSGGQVHFQCSRGILLESTNAADARCKITPLERLDLPSSPPSSVSPTFRLHDVSSRPRLSPDFETYTQLVTQYTKRNMRFPEDGIKAITGLLNLLEPKPSISSMIFGLPKHFMDLALLWQPATGSNVRLKRKFQFPSWSWAGWEALDGSEGGVRYEKPYRHQDHLQQYHYHPRHHLLQFHLFLPDRDLQS
ncbi:hypothetical protein CKAH01_03894 [Colletotrichum kahawae]|uniref:Heterokaryon incompatibility domain-containing protein n=1 Tax=Colletotrichum kahawae TaxID=34407 RepID=A0AAD9YPR6_COLKA|nr:hypothetical protein CKAH01_03894 [Colletotrichum kahawae]